jgi:hypothetical protein
MVALIVVALMLLVGPLAILVGADSRLDDVDRRKRTFPR